jgi:ATP-binding cassette, subfamily B, bacterial
VILPSDFDSLQKNHFQATSLFYVGRFMDANTRKRLRRALSFVRPYRLTVGVIIGLTLVVAALNAIEPLILKVLFDGLGGGNGVPQLVQPLVALVVLALAREGLNVLTSWLTWRSRLAMQHAILGSTVERLQELSLDYHRNESVGGIMTRLDRGIQGFLGAVSDMAFNVFPALLYLTVSILIMIRLEWRLALVVLLFAPAPILITAIAAPEFTRRERTLLDRWTKIYARFNEVLAGILTVKSFAMERRETQRFLDDVRHANGVVERGVKIDAGTGAAQNMVVSITKIVAIGVGGLLILRGEATLGTLVAFLGYVGGLFGPVQGLSGIYKTLRTASVSLETIFSIIDSEEKVEDAPGAVEVKSIQGKIHFDKVRFSYGPSRRPVLDGIDVRIEPGETVALVGPSGAGKTTMMNLLQRFYDPTEGVVRLDGMDLRNLKQHSLRQQIGIVIQEPLLFNDTVLNNIRYGRPEAPPSAVTDATRAANAHDFIMRLPEGYETRVGERGNLLSTGERQRLAIARALLKDPPLLILDEPTSALDAETEALVQAALTRLMTGRTAFIIAHRLSTIISADRILVLRDGRIVEDGRHTDLMARGDYYASLVRKQVLGLAAAPEGTRTPLVGRPGSEVFTRNALSAP